MEDCVAIRTLEAENPKMTNREIARHIGISDNTVKTALENGQPPSYDRTNRANAKLDAFREVIFDMASFKYSRPSRIINELRSKGYTNGRTAVLELLSEIKIDTQRHFTPYEAQPGGHALFDRIPCTVSMGGQLTKIFFLFLCRRFSHFRVYDVSLAENQGAVLEALENDIIASGGVPHRIQTDNTKVFVNTSSRSSFQWNARYPYFCGRYGFEPSRLQPSYP
jgi:transposase